MNIKRKAQGSSGPGPATKFRRIDSNTTPLPTSPTSEAPLEGVSSCEVAPGSQEQTPEDQQTVADIEDQDAVESAAGSSQSLQRFPLTKENLHRLAMSTNSKGPKTVSAQSLRTGTSGDSSRSISTTSEGFANRALENGVLDAVRSGKQTVADAEVMKKLLASRGSASPTQSQYDRFADRIVEASNEQGTIAVYSDYIFQNTEETHFDIGYRRKIDKMWTEFPKSVGFNNGLSAPKPDMIEGFARDTFPPTIEHIRSSKLVRDEPKYVALPHVAVEYKAREKGLHEAKVQAGYDGAAMVYGRNEALKFIGKADPPTKPAVLTATTNGQEWNVYAHYAHPNEATGKEEYYQCRMVSGSTENLRDYKQGRKVLRNMQDFAREQASELRDSLHKDYIENGSTPFSQRSGTKQGSKSVASKAPSVSSNGSGQQQSPGQATPKSASSKGSSTSAAQGPNVRQRDGSVSGTSQQQPAAKSRDELNKSKPGCSPQSSKQMMPPPHKPSATGPGTPGASTARNIHQNSNASGTPRPSPSKPSDNQSPTPQAIEIPRKTATKPPGQALLSSSSSSSSRASDGSTQSGLSAEARRYRTRDEEQKDLLRRRSDSPDKDRPARPQESRTDVPPKKTSLFGRFGTGKRKDERVGND